jgi:hypothetical protein
MAEALAAEPRRTPAEILSDVLHAKDVAMRARIKAGGWPPTAEEWAEIVDALDQAGRLASQVIALRIAADQPVFTPEKVDAEIRRIEAELRARGIDPDAGRLALSPDGRQ